eukprot:3756846-Heterocapsa_arctica.AAC.1
MGTLSRTSTLVGTGNISVVDRPRESQDMPHIRLQSPALERWVLDQCSATSQVRHLLDTSPEVTDLRAHRLTHRMVRAGDAAHKARLRRIQVGEMPKGPRGREAEAGEPECLGP